MYFPFYQSWTPVGYGYPGHTAFVYGKTSDDANTMFQQYVKFYYDDPYDAYCPNCPNPWSPLGPGVYGIPDNIMKRFENIISVHRVDSLTRYDDLLAIVHGPDSIRLYRVKKENIPALLCRV